MKYFTPLMQLEDRINDKFDSMSESLKRVAGFLLTNKNSVALNTISSIALEVGVQPSTLIRFAQSLGYKGFNEIKQIYRLELLDTESNYLNRANLVKKVIQDPLEGNLPHLILKDIASACSDSLLNLEQNILDVDISQAVDMMGNASRIYIVGFGRSFGIASYLSYSLNHLHIPTSLVHGLGDTLKEQVNMIEKSDLLIAISFAPYSEDTLAACEIAHQKSAKLLVITDQNLSPLSSLCNVCLVVKESKFRDAFRTLSASSSLVQSLCISLIYNKKSSNST